MPTATDPATRLVLCHQPIAAVAKGDLVAYARRGEARPLIRNVVEVTRSSVFRPEANVWDELVAVTIALHPRRHHPKSGADVITGWASEATVEVAGWVYAGEAA